MNNKQRVLSFIFSIILGALGFGCFAVAAMVQENLGNIYANIIGISGFVFLILSLIYLLVKAPKMISSEMEELAERMKSETTFFTAIQLEESINSLKEKFYKAGFSQEQNYIHKKSFSFAKDYINYYVIIVENMEIEQYIDFFLEKIDSLIESQKRFEKNNYIYLIFFKNSISDDELIPLKNLIINQTVIQEIPSSRADTLVPIVYNIDNKEFMIRMNHRKLSLKPINIAMKNFCKIVIR